MMGKKLYVGVVMLLLLCMAIGAPARMLAEKAGILEIRDLGNRQTSSVQEKDTGILRAAAVWRDCVTEVYTKDLPFYYETVFTYNKAEEFLNQPMAVLYSRARMGQETVTVQEKETIPSVQGESDMMQEKPKDPQKLVSVQSSLLSTSDTHRYYQVDAVFEDGAEISFLDTAVRLDDEQKEARVRSQAEALNKIIAADDNVNFYFMLLTRMQDTDYYEDIIAGEESTKKYADLFLSLLDERAVSAKWDIGTVRDRTERVYLTDHHWTTYGSYTGFLQLCEMICPEHEPVKLGEAVDFPDSRFYGSYARMCRTLDLWDTFRVYDYDVGPFKTRPKWDFDTQKEFLAAQRYVTPDQNIYAIFFPEVYHVRYPENQTGRNLLILGDSYTQGFVELLGSAFDNTYAYYYTIYPGMKYKSILKRCHITDVLFMQFSDRILFDQYGDDQLSSILLDE